jgi:hemerythrin superfamily protein
MPNRRIWKATEAAIMGLSERVSDSAASPQAGPDALVMLENEHRQIMKLFDEFEAADVMRRTAIVDQVCRTLRVHAQIEEDILYPAAREALEKDGELIDDTGIEHASIKVLVTRLEQSGPADEYYAALVRVLADYVKYHFEEEEQDLFSMLRGANIDLAEVGTQLRLRRRELQGGRG